MKKAGIADGSVTLKLKTIDFNRVPMGGVGLRTVHELCGIACHALETQPPAKQSTCVSQTFGKSCA